MAKQTNDVSGWTGWIFFGGFMMMLLGIFQIVAGLTALLNDKWLVAGENNLLVLDFTTWGWIHLIIGIVVLLAGYSVMQGAFWARVMGVIFASLAIVANMAYVNAYPIWSLLMIVFAIFVIYAIIVHGNEVRE